MIWPSSCKEKAQQITVEKKRASKLIKKKAANCKLSKKIKAILTQPSQQQNSSWAVPAQPSQQQNSSWAGPAQPSQQIKGGTCWKCHHKEKTAALHSPQQRKKAEIEKMQLPWWINWNWKGWRGKQKRRGVRSSGSEQTTRLGRSWRKRKKTAAGLRSSTWQQWGWAMSEQMTRWVERTTGMGGANVQIRYSSSSSSRFFFSSVKGAEQ